MVVTEMGYGKPGFCSGTDSDVAVERWISHSSSRNRFRAVKGCSFCLAAIARVAKRRALQI